MISVEQAHRLIEKNSRPLKTQWMPVKKSLGFIIANSIRAPFDLPVADNSAMDGYVARSRDVKKASKKRPVRLPVRDVIRAGDTHLKALGRHEAFRIMTGAFVPKYGDVVIPKERAVIQDNCLTFESPLRAGHHIRYRGEEIQKGDIVIQKHSKINPATVGILASLGITQVKVYVKPGVSIIATGHELVEPGNRLKRGQIYDSNSFMMTSALHRMGLAPVHASRVGDRPQELRKRIQKALKQSDVLILTGGVSVGDYDYVKEILGEQGVQPIFWKVSQKPGKPLYFGKKGKILVFGLPGNPASVFTCFYQYVYPSLRRLSGFSDPYMRRVKAAVQMDIQADGKRHIFLKAKTERNHWQQTVHSLRHQGSHMISTLHAADSFILIPPGKGTIKKGEPVDVDLLPYESE